MSVKTALFVGGGTSVALMSFLIGRYYASMTAERAAEMSEKMSKTVPAAQFHQMGKLLMISAPITLAMFVWIGLFTDYVK